MHNKQIRAPGSRRNGTLPLSRNDAGRQPRDPGRFSAIRPRALREDRILHEIHATGGNVRRISDLFGLSVEGTTRYLATIEHPDLSAEDR